MLRVENNSNKSGLPIGTKPKILKSGRHVYESTFFFWGGGGVHFFYCNNIHYLKKLPTLLTVLIVDT